MSRLGGTSQVRCLARVWSLRWLPITLLLAGCEGIATHQIGPVRAITIEEDINSMRPLASLSDGNLANFYSYSADKQASIRNQIVTARMYLADIQYEGYEAR